MRIAISATGQGMDSNLDPRFGRADYLLIIETDTMEVVQVIDNRASQNAAHGAGINAASMVVDAGAQAVLTGQVGPKAFAVLDAAGVKVISDMSGTVRDAVERFNHGNVSASSGPDVDAHSRVVMPPSNTRFGGPGQGAGPGAGGRCRGAGGGGRGLGGGRGAGGGGGGGRGRGRCAAMVAGFGRAFQCIGRNLGLNIRRRRRDLSCMRASGRSLNRRPARGFGL